MSQGCTFLPVLFEFELGVRISCPYESGNMDRSDRGWMKSCHFSVFPINLFSICGTACSETMKLRQPRREEEVRFQISSQALPLNNMQVLNQYHPIPTVERKQNASSYMQPRRPAVRQQSPSVCQVGQVNIDALNHFSNNKQCIF